MTRSATRQFELFPERTEEAEAWADKLLAAFADATLEGGFLPLAREAVAACPGNLAILTLAATAALLDEQPDQALPYLQLLSDAPHGGKPVRTTLMQCTQSEIWVYLRGTTTKPVRADS